MRKLPRCAQLHAISINKRGSLTSQHTFKRLKKPTQAVSDIIEKTRSLDISVACFIGIGIKQKDHAFGRGLLLGLIFRL
ncbi:hypothetical protein C6H48_00610 [Vibrio cholerae]